MSADIIRLTLPAGQFDYAALPEDVASQARAAAERIRARNRDAYTAAVEIGHELLLMRDRLEHGRFLGWVEAECGFSKSAAYNFMNVAERLPAKFPTNGNLALSAAYKLTAGSTPEPVRQEVVRRLEAGERIATATVDELLRKAKDDAREARITADERKKRERKAERQSRSKEQREAERKRQEEKYKAERQKKEEAARTAAQMVFRALGDRLTEFAAILNSADDGDFRYLLAEAAGLDVPRWWRESSKRPVPLRLGLLDEGDRR